MHPASTSSSTDRLRRTGGFTLLELLLAMTVAASVGVVLVVSLRIAFAARDAAVEEVGTARALSAAFGRIEDDLRGVMRPTGVFAEAFDGTDEADDEGRAADRVTYTTNNPWWPAAEPMGELFRVELSVVDRAVFFDPVWLDAEAEEDDDTEPADFGRCLVRTVTTNLLPSGEAAQTQQLLVDRVVGFDVRYSDGTDWLDDWQSTEQDDTLPTAVEVTLSVLSEGVRVTDDDLEASIMTRRFVSALPMAPSAAQRQVEAAGG